MFLVNSVGGVGSSDGVYSEEGEGADHRYQRMGGADEYGWYFYLYRGTERANTWVVGIGTSFEARRAWYRAPAGGGGDRLPPEEDWQAVFDRSKDGRESGRDEPDMRVTGVNLKEATADEIYEKGGEPRDDGIVCKTRDQDSGNNGEWKYISWTDKQICDGTKNCENGLDEPEGCKRPVVVVVGSDGKDGVYNRNSRYKQENGHNTIFKQGNSWVIAEGTNQLKAVVLYKSGKSNELPRKGWKEIVKKGRMFVQNPVPDLQVVKVPRDFDGIQAETEKGLVCKSGHTNVWHFIAEGDKKRCNGVCNRGTCRD